MDIIFNMVSDPILRISFVAQYYNNSCAGKQLEELEKLRLRIKAFVEERDWNQFHSPKNLSMALIVEAGELVEQFQWLKESESFELSPKKREAVENELADIFVYLIRIADQLDINLVEAANSKILSNGEKYPVDLVRGSSKKYSEY
jgi:NTP pyrophosphatase (non-canonical NTP hydrolase)